MSVGKAQVRGKGRNIPGRGKRSAACRAGGGRAETQACLGDTDCSSAPEGRVLSLEQAGSGKTHRTGDSRKTFSRDKFSK